MHCRSEIEGIESIEGLCARLNIFVVTIWGDPSWAWIALPFFYIFGMNDIFRQSEIIQGWLIEMAYSVGELHNSPESTVFLEAWMQYPDIQIENYYAPPSGYLTFSQFF
eukprot:401421_1